MYYENGIYLDSITGDSEITWVEVIKPTKTIPKIFNAKKATCKMANFYISLALFLIAILLLITIIICTDQNKNIYYHITTPVIN